MATFTNIGEIKSRRRLAPARPREPRLTARPFRDAAEAGGHDEGAFDVRPVSLLDEARRRLKSNMKADITLLRLAPEGIEHPSAEAVLTEMENRLQSMAALHKSLCRAGKFDGIDLAVYLRHAASLRNSPPQSPLAGGWVIEAGGQSLIWTREGNEGAADSSGVFMDLETALASAPAAAEGLAQRAVYACAIAAPPWIFRWRSPQAGTALTGHVAKPGEVGIRVRPSSEGVAVELSFSDWGPGLPDVFDLKGQRSLGLQLGSVLARLVKGSGDDQAPSEAVFTISFVPSHRAYETRLPV